MMRAFLRSRAVLVLVALCLLQFALVQTPPAAAGTRPCCLDEWQGGGVCPSGYRLASYCGAGCENCGTFTCIPSTTLCYK
ncbi:MAG TPA: hypothetical protein VF789_28355 [Thermoanaerobaculia bacterium]